MQNLKFISDLFGILVIMFSYTVDQWAWACWHIGHMHCMHKDMYQYAYVIIL